MILNYNQNYLLRLRINLLIRILLLIVILWGKIVSAVGNWLRRFPDPSLHRLTRINLAATSSAHIILALSYGMHDRHIGALNKMIVGLLLARHKARRRGDFSAEARIENKLQDLHGAINAVTGTEIHHPEPGSACKSVKRMPAM
jgi:hypothetical protein